MEHGMHIEVPLPEGAEVATYSDDFGEWVSVQVHNLANPRAYSAEYPLLPPPNTDFVFADLVAAGANHEVAQQIVDHMAAAGWAI